VTRLGARPPLDGLVRAARKDGREVVVLRCAAENGGWSVECEVYPLAGLRVEPLRPGPYQFADDRQAETFLNEAVLALTYLGCEVS
jgi:hypothetical protein